jgi:uncharacterized membrane protein YdjX (TVP38/TMEM64 family)
LKPSKARLAAAAAAALLLLAALRALDLQSLLAPALARVAALGPWGPALFIVLYVAACVLLVPGSALTLGAGAVFGVVRGSILVSVAATAGAVAAFLVGRYAARDWVAGRMAKDPRFKAIDDAVAREGWKIVLLTRLSPVFPFTLLNYAFGLTRVRLRDYCLASWAGMLPGTVMYVYLGSLAGELAAVGGRRARTPGEWGLYALGLAATRAVTVYATRVARRALERL